MSLIARLAAASREHATRYHAAPQLSTTNLTLPQVRVASMCRVRVCYLRGVCSNAVDTPLSA